MQFRTRLLGPLSLMIFLTTVGRCDTMVAGNIGTNTTVSSSAGLQVQGPIAGAPSAFVAISFTPAGNFNLTEISVAIGGTSGSFDLALYSNQGGMPGGELFDFGTESGPASDRTVTTLSTSGASVIQGTRYWLVASPGTDTTELLWALETPGGGTVYSYGPGLTPTPGAWQSFAVGTAYFEVFGATPVAAPEPGGLCVTGAGLLVLGLLGVRESRSDRASRRFLPTRSEGMSGW